MPSGHFTNADVDTLETLVEIPVIGRERLAVQFTVTTADLSDFNVDAKVTDDMGYSTVATASGDFTTPVLPVIKASGNLNLAAAGATVHYLVVDCRGFHTIRLQAAGTSSVVTGAWTAI